MLLITADDRTGALEAGGACAALGFRARLASTPDASADCALIDLASRHCAPAEAATGILAAHNRPARFRCHKMDSGLRGNWAHEVAALLAAGHRVGLLASFPDAGRRCHRGSVFIHDVPVLETAFGKDPRSRLISNRPVDYLRAAGCDAALARADVVVLNANDNAELAAAAARCRAEGRMLVGTTGGIEAYAAGLPGAARPHGGRRLPPPPHPALVVCGSLHPLSRAQVRALDCAVVEPDRAAQAVQFLRAGADVALATPIVRRAADAAAEAMAARLASLTWRCLAKSSAPTVIALGGDTAAAILGERPLRVLGNLAVGVPICQADAAGTVAAGVRRDLRIVTKGGGIGEIETLKRILRPSVVAPGLDAAGGAHQE